MVCGEIGVISTCLANYNSGQDRLENMNVEQFQASIAEEQSPPAGLSIPLAALWWDAKGDWARAHSLVDELESVEGTAVHAYLHRKEGSASNADYWYQRSGRSFYRPALDAERTALIDGLLGADGKA
jgi:hypothetical protein